MFCKFICNSSLIPGMPFSFNCPLLTKKACPTPTINRGATVVPRFIVGMRKKNVPRPEPVSVITTRAISPMYHPLRRLLELRIGGAAGVAPQFIVGVWAIGAREAPALLLVGVVGTLLTDAATWVGSAAGAGDDDVILVDRSVCGDILWVTAPKSSVGYMD